MSAPVVCIGVAAHRPYRMPADSAYLPIHVGAALHPGACPGFQPDDEGDSISALNASYSELTALYWLWRNSGADVKGLVHYRRLLGSPDRARMRSRDPFDRVAAGEELAALAASFGAVVARRRDYLIESVGSHYTHTHDVAHLDACREVLSELSPDHVPAWDRLMASHRVHAFNMLVAPAEVFDEYCAWLFPVVGELVRRIDSSGMTPFEARWPGRVSELLLDPWLEVAGIAPAELPVVSPEPVEWVAKGTSFLAAKFLGKKYEGSF